MASSPSNERDLIERSRQRDETAFASLVDVYTQRLYRIVRRLIPDTMEAESIVQETFWRFWNVLPRYDADRPLMPYLATIATNLARDRYRRERNLDLVEADTALENYSGSLEPDIESGLDRRKLLESLARAVENLPFEYRAVISLRYDGELGYEEIAQTLSLPLNTVRTHLRRAKLTLRRQIEEVNRG